MKPSGLSATLLLLIACNDDIVQPDALVGSWGGIDAGLVVTAAEATLTLTCGAGKSNGPIELDTEARFTVMGEVWTVGGAPPQPGEEPVHHPVLLSGRVDADRLALTITSLDPAVNPAPSKYRLVRGAEPVVLMCP